MAVDAEDGGTTVVVNAEPGAGVAVTVNTSNREIDHLHLRRRRLGC